MGTRRGLPAIDFINGTLRMQAAPAGVDGLVVRTALGDDLAFTELYSGTRELLLTVSLRIARDRDLAEEALHDSFLKIWKHASHYRPDTGPALAWMSTIVRNHTRDLVRRAREVPDVDGRLTAQVVDPGPSTESAVLERLESRALCACLEALDPAHRQALALAFAHDMSHAEVARHLGRPLGTVKTHIRRGIFLLRECMDARDRRPPAAALS